MKAYLDTVREVLDTGTRKENRTGVDTSMPSVMEAPSNSKSSPLSAVRIRVLRKWRSVVLAPTLVTQGALAGLLTVFASGPLLPADTATKSPAL